MKLHVLVIGCLAVCLPCYGESLNNLVDAAYRNELTENEIFSNIQFKDIRARLLPHNEAVQKIFNESFDLLKPSILVESFSFIKKPSSWKNGSWTNEEKTKLLNEVTSISTLAGLQYYSASRKEMRTFYETSQIISDPQNRLVLGDPVFTQDAPLLAGFVLYAQQKDLTFGDNIYRYDYYIEDSAIFFTQTNVTTMNYSIVPLVQKEKLKSFVAFLDADDSILIYIATMTKASPLPGMKEKIGASFTNRSAALLEWFKSKNRI